MPCTVLATLEENSYQETMEISVRGVRPTYHAERAKIAHPFKPILRCAEGLGRTPFCPPCAMSDVSFEEGAGVTLVPGGGTKKFRALLRVLDAQATIKRESDGSPVVRCSRKVCCALRPEGDDISYTLSSVGPIDFATRLTSPRKNEFLHAIVSWRSKEDLTLLSFSTVAEDFKVFFLMAAELNKKFVTEGAGTGLQPAEENTTPSRRPEPWSKRQRVD